LDIPFFNKGEIIGIENHPLKHDVPKPHSRGDPKGEKGAFCQLLIPTFSIPFKRKLKKP
jgi:hypothetical protein